MSSTYVVQQGDTWTSIAAANGMTAAWLQAANSASSASPSSAPTLATIVIPNPPAPNPVAPSNGTTTATAVCQAGGDVALSATTALLFSDKAPLAAQGGDGKAVWACVTPGFNVSTPEVLLYFHGHNNFVTEQPGSSGPQPRKPDWAVVSPTGGKGTGKWRAGFGNPAVNLGASQKGGAGTFFGFNAIATKAATGKHFPTALAPENATLDDTWDATQIPNPKPPPATVDTQGFWSREYLPANVSLTGSKLGDLVNDSLARLACLSAPGGSPYLTKTIVTGGASAPAAGAVQRLFLTGHSGGGKNIFDACTSDLALNTPTSLWAFDASYGPVATIVAAVRAFCVNWSGKSLLGNAVGQSRVVIMSRPDSGTRPGANAIKADLSTGSPSFASQISDITYTSSANDAALATKLKAFPIVFIWVISPNHGQVPQHFSPILLMNEP
jgi:hypothetical protein